MPLKRKETVHLIYGICLSVLILSVGICFVLSCLSIYKSGTSPFTRESVAAHFDRIAIPVYLCIAGVIGGGVLSLALPLESGKVRPYRESKVTLDILSAKLNLTDCEASLQATIRGERRFRRGTTVMAGILSALAVLPALAWCVNPNHFSVENLNSDIRTAAALVIPCAVLALGMRVVAILLCGASVSRETTLIKAALKAVPTAVSGKDSTYDKALSHKKKLTSDPRFLWGVRGVVFAIGVAFIVLGIRNGGMADVLGKAIRICTECIGLG